mgnify:CR=1 FL=1
MLLQPEILEKWRKNSLKYLICSDIHGSLRAGKILIDLDQKNNFDRIFCLGDFLYNGARNDVPVDYNPKELAKIINSLASKIIACKGNCESNVDLVVLNFSLPIFNSYRDGNCKFYLTHGDDEDLFYKPKNDEIFMYGHTHVPVLMKNSFNGIVLNPGSMTFPKGKIDKSFITIIDGRIELFEFDYDKDNYKIINSYKLENQSISFEK